MKWVRLLAVVLASALVSHDAAAQDQTGRSDRIQRQVEAIASAPGIEGRRAAIIDRLEALGLEGVVTWFDPPASVRVDRRGANVTAELPSGPSTVLLLGAHYDHFGRAQGVIDNATGVAAVLELAEAFLRRPAQNFRIALAFFDLEEDGRLGSRALVADSLNAPLPDVFLNFDIFGYGDGLWIGAENPNALLPRLIRSHGTAADLDVVVDSMYPSSDHVSFRQTRTDSYGISLLDAADIHMLLERFRSGGRSTGETPRIFTIMHTAEDTMDKLDAEAVAKGVEAMEQALRELDLELGALSAVIGELPTRRCT